MTKIAISTFCAGLMFAGAALAEDPRVEVPTGNSNAGGQPAAHDSSGADWGAAVSGLAKDGGMGDHASGGKAGGPDDSDDVEE
ncbi:hypothetical protein [Palleronia caenipelagi]|uniref:Uncharacterized protein n=1 Tax=Palleronia caenipelagi TaxID=2489174 RepID=A0A547Q9G6_9RHOB|nr:hypothetical protein [Palleronia caenipelagi]TRD23045.1 hypothetical protein FEV53_02445 [Palleronia caenipelagi]